MEKWTCVLKVWKTPSEATRSIQGKVKGITTNTLEAAYYAVHSISYSSDSSTRPNTMFFAEKQNVAFNHFGLCFWIFLMSHFCPWQTCSVKKWFPAIYVMRSRQKLRTFSSLGASATCIIEATLSTACTRAGWMRVSTFTRVQERCCDPTTANSKLIIWPYKCQPMLPFFSIPWFHSLCQPLSKSEPHLHIHLSGFG